ncbi:MAG TPA: VOC family protein [Bryobacteraceae bacterium]|nr:VOC family protein [Bryobacteraceae bacterium]
MESATVAAPFGLSAIGQIGITVTDIDRAIAFYRDALGMKLLFQVANMGFFDCGGVRLMLSISERAAESYSSILYFKVPDIQQAFQTLSGRGAAFEGEPHQIARMPNHDLWMAFFRDPDRNLLALMSEVPRA